jgi:hypothetical protein
LAKYVKLVRSANVGAIAANWPQQSLETSPQMSRLSACRADISLLE